MDLFPAEQRTAQATTEGVTTDGQLLFAGAAADVLRSGATVVKKVLRVSPNYFYNSAVERGEEILAQYRETFAKQTSMWSWLRHQNIAILSAPSEATLSFEQELCEQGDLCNYIEHGGGSQFICYQIIEGILAGLAYLHSHDPVIVHGNIKASKIFVTADGTIKLGEFGLTESLTKFSHLVPAVSFSGLVRWTSPERLKLEIGGHSDAASTQSDVWSFGCTLFEISAGMLPYSKYKHDPKIVQRIMLEEAPGNLEHVILPSPKSISGGETESLGDCGRMSIARSDDTHKLIKIFLVLTIKQKHKSSHYPQSYLGNQDPWPTEIYDDDTSVSTLSEFFERASSLWAVGTAISTPESSVFGPPRITPLNLASGYTYDGKKKSVTSMQGREHQDSTSCDVPRTEAGSYEYDSGSRNARGSGRGYGDRGRGRSVLRVARGRGEARRGYGIFNAGPATIDSRLTTHADGDLVASFHKLAVEESQLPHRPDFGTAGQEIKLRTNFFPVEYGKAIIYDYDISVEPQTGIKRIMKRLLQIFMSSPEFAPYAASASHDNMRRLVSLKEIPVTGAAQVFSVGVTYYEEDEDGPRETSKKYRVALKLATKHETTEMTKFLGGAEGYGTFDPQPMLSAFNILLAKYPSQHGVMVGRNKWFFPTLGQATNLGGGLEAYRGFYSSARPSFQQLMVNVNAATTALYRPGNLTELFRQFGPSRASQLKSFVYNLRIEMTHTGRRMRKAIKGIYLKDSARNYLFVCDEFGGQKMSVEAYFERKYKIKLKYPLMPLVDIKGDKERPILVPPEVCTILPNQPYRGKLSDEHTASMIHVACQPPNVNAQAITGEGLSSLGLVGRNSPLAQMGLHVGAEMATVPGRVLPAPTVHYQNKKPANVNNAAWNMRDVKFAVGMRLDNWAVLFIQDGGRYDMKAATSKHIVEGFVDACGRAGMATNRQLPPMVDVQLPPRSAEAFSQMRPNAMNAIASVLKAIRPKPKIVLVVLSSHDSAIYNGIKYLCDVRLDVLTVCVTANNFKDGQVRYNTNVGLKFNAKLGGINHTIGPEDPVMSWLRQQPTMLVGSDVTHPSLRGVCGIPSIASVVGSVDSMFGQFPASLRLQESKKEVISDLTDMMAERLAQFRAKNKVLPQRILFFHNGVSEGQFLAVRGDDLPKIREAFSKFSTSERKYNPKLTILVAKKQHHARFFPTKDEDANNGNCKPGTVVDHGVTSIYGFDFYLQAHAGLRGTSRPTRYTVIHNENPLSADQVQSLVYGISYMFARATKAVSLVPPVYYAGLACERGRCYLAKLLAAFEMTVSYGAQVSKEVAVEEAHKHWGEGPTGPSVKETMFYI